MTTHRRYVPPPLSLPAELDDDIELRINVRFARERGRPLFARKVS